MGKRLFVVYRHYYGYLCLDWSDLNNLGFHEKEDIEKNGYTLVTFKTRAEADCWRNKISEWQRDWFCGENEFVVEEIESNIKFEEELNLWA